MRPVQHARIMVHHSSKAFLRLMAELSGEDHSFLVSSLILIAHTVHGMEVYVLFQDSRSYTLCSRYGDSLLQCMHG